jgi:hypothetical protein
MLIHPPRINALDVVRSRGWSYEHTAYHGRGRPTNTIPGSTVCWVREKMHLSDVHRIKFFLLHGLPFEQKRVCVVHSMTDTTLYITCLKTNVSYDAVFDHVWELLMELPAPTPAAQRVADRRVRRTAAMNAARLDEIQRRPAPTDGDRQSTVTRVATSSEVRLYRHE